MSNFDEFKVTDKVDGTKLVKEISERIKVNFNGSSIAEDVADDILSSTDGFMDEKQIGAMIVDLISELANEGRNE